MSTKITCVYDEGSQPGTSLIGAKGTAFLVEKEGKRILFNTGLRDRYLIHNMEHLEIVPDSIDMVVVSQSNPCDAGALNGLLKVREQPVDVYCPNGLYGKRGFLSRSVGLSESNGPKAIFHDLEPWDEIVPGVFITPFYYDEKGYGETFLVIKEGTKVLILSGRCSCYPDKVISDVRDRMGAKPAVFMGPVFLEKRKKAVAKTYADILAQVPELYINHCVGKDGIVNLRVTLGLAGVNDFYVGNTYVLS